ncbi:MAG: rhodanese-like domain-containing protein [Candidatus Zixiibacteriota bacterium]|nr:MAG: rhodanese-like domain-containing protein [candidate division Zixibacteria bacterium]
MMIKQALIVIAFSAAVAVCSNLISGSGIPFVGNWPSVSGSDTVAVPPSADEGDPPFISLDEAAAKFQLRDGVFIDARDPEDYEYGRIKGALNLPYDYLEDYWDEIVPDLSKDKQYIIYCSGTECELSLFLARDLVYNGFEKVFIFYGGWREWERAKLPTEGG